MMKAKFEFYLEDFPDIEAYYLSQYGYGIYIALKAVDSSLCDRERYPITENDLIICKTINKPIKDIYSISDRFKVEDIGEIVSVCKDIKL